MARFNAAKSQPPRSKSVLTTSQTPDLVTHEGAPAYSRDAKSALFLLGASYLGGESFYESVEERDARAAELARLVAVEDGAWMGQFLRWLRNVGNMRTFPILVAAEAVHARLAAVAEGRVAQADLSGSNRSFVRSILQRADEPGELVAYWSFHFGEKKNDGNVKAKLPYPVKMGINDAIEGAGSGGIYNEFSALKYDTDSKGVRFGDVLELTHPRGTTEYRDQLYVWLLDRRHGREAESYPLLTRVTARRQLNAIPPERRRASLDQDDISPLLAQAGATWEWLASWLGGSLDARFWEMMIPRMGYMALLRNLRNFDEKGISASARKDVAAKLVDPEQVAGSRQFPFRFFSAYLNISSDWWREPLREALDLSTRNIPELSGRTLVLIDTSASMEMFSSTAIRQNRKSEDAARQLAASPRRVDMAALFGVAVSCKNAGKVDLRIFGDRVSSPIPVRKGDSVLRLTEKIRNMVGNVGHGTEIARSLKSSWDGHDRVLVFTDEQTFGGGGYWSHEESSVTSAIPPSIPLYSWNLAGYKGAMMPSGPHRYQLGGLTDATFQMIPLLETGARAQWPWEIESTSE